MKIAAGKYGSGKKDLKAQRNAELKSQYVGHNYSELARKFGISARQVRRLVERK